MNNDMPTFINIEIHDTVKDTSPNCVQKTAFEKHLNFYLDKIRNCNILFSTLEEMKQNYQNYISAYKCAPAFWNSTQYSTQMCLTTDIISFLSNDKDSLLKYFNQIKTNKNQIFTKKWIRISKNPLDNNEEEQNITKHNDIDYSLTLCENLLTTTLKQITNLKKARNKIFCHFEKTFFDEDICNQQFLNNINTKLLTTIIENIGKILIILHEMYYNEQTSIKYENQNDVKTIFEILKLYDENTSIILSALHSK